MLTSLRELLRSKVAFLLFGLIIISMGVWGITDVFRGDLGDQVVKAGPRGFTIQEFDVRVEQFLQRQRAEGGLVSRRDAVEQGAVDQLFALQSSRMANLGYAEAIGAATSLDRATTTIATNTAFIDPVSGSFDVDLYRRVLRSNQLTPDLYENDLRDGLTLGVLQDGIGSALLPPDMYTALQARYLAESREIAWFIVERDDAGELTPATDEDLEAFYDSQLSAYAIPERRRLGVLSLSAADFIHRVDISADDLRAIYEAQKVQRFSGPETRRFLQISVSNRDAALTAFGRLAGGATADSFTAEDIRAVTPRTALRSEMVNGEFAEQLFAPALRAGGVVGPIQTGDTWLVARLDEIVPGTPTPFEDVADIIREEGAAAEAANLFAQAEAQLFDQIGAGLTLAEIAAEIGAPVIHYLPVTESGRLEDGQIIPGLAAKADMLAEAFLTPVGEVTNPVNAGEEIAIAEVVEIIAPRTPELAEIRDRVAAAYDRNRETEALTDFARALSESIDSGDTSMAQAASGLGAVLSRTAQPISRANYESAVPQAALVPTFSAVQGDVFTAPGPAPDQVTIVQLEAINDPDPTEVSVLGGLVGAEIRQSVESDILSAMDASFRDTLNFRADMGSLDVYKRQILDQQ